MSYTFRRMIAVILIALAIAVIIIGLVLFVKNRGEVARHGVETNKNTQVATDTGTKVTTDGSSGSTVVNGSKTTSSSTTNTDHTTTTTSNSTTNTSSASNLPTTGSADSIATIIALGALAFSIGYYVQSVRFKRARTVPSHL